MVEVMIVAAEASSAQFALRLLEHWQKQKRQIKAFGVGTQAMQDLGFERLGKAEDMAVVGIAEIIEHYSDLKATLQRLVDAAIQRRPKVVILMDYPDFNLILAKKLYAAGLNVVYYVAPQIWAWRQGRVHKIKKFFKKVLVLFPFELAFYQKHQVAAQFVGHPLLDEISDKYFSAEYRQTHRQKFGLQEKDIVLGLMPGSRRGELRHNLGTQLQAARLLCAKFPQIRVAILVAPTLDKESVRSAIPDDFSYPYILLQDHPAEMIHLTDYVIVASGTATLLVGLLQKPMVIMYRVKWATYVIGKMLTLSLRFVGLPNLVLGRLVVPEKIQTGPQSLFEEIRKYLQDQDYSEKVRGELAQLQVHLGQKGATQRVAQALEEYL